MNHLTSTAVLLAMLLLMLSACDKVPLRENRGHFDLASAHWFENEKTQYVFFSVDGLRHGQAKLSWPARFEISTGEARSTGLAIDADGFAALDFSKGVHRHRLVACGEGRVCGSFSFHAEQPVPVVTIRYRYNLDSPLTEAKTIATSVHRAGAGSASESALVYGVFNADNSRLQFRIHDNFGSPDNDEIQQYGMQRSYMMESTSLAEVSRSEHARAASASGSPFLFPADICVPAIQRTTRNAFQFSGREAWSKLVFSPDDTKSSACFTASLLDRDGRALTTAPAIARRNPVLAAQALSISSPLQEARRVFLVLSYCPDRSESEGLTSPEFLDYQRYILGAPKAGVDACFAVGEEEQFATDLDRVLTRKLQIAREGNSDRADLFLTIAINHRLAPVIAKKFHEIIAQKINDRITSEAALASPRLVGAFVYDSQAVDPLITSQTRQMVWCPRKETKNPKLGTLPDADTNCTPRGAGDITLGPFNFLIPLGPFPTLDTFVEYSHRYGGDKGQSRNPQLLIRSVKTNENSVTDPASQLLYTFFDGQRISLDPGERLKFCAERDTNQLLSRTVFTQDQLRGHAPVISTLEAQRLTLGESDAPTLYVGLRWENAFIGGFSFESPFEGKVFGLIPLSKTIGKSQKLGDQIWTRTNWDIGPLLQKCVRFCGHPFFDEAGVYQINSAWNLTDRCPAPKTAEPEL